MRWSRYAFSRTLERFVCGENVIWPRTAPTIYCILRKSEPYVSCSQIFFAICEAVAASMFLSQKQKIVTRISVIKPAAVKVRQTPAQQSEVLVTLSDYLNEMSWPSSCIYTFAHMQTHLTNTWSERSCVICNDAFWFAWIFPSVKRHQTKVESKFTNSSTGLDQSKQTIGVKTPIEQINTLDVPVLS